MLPESSSPPTFAATYLDFIEEQRPALVQAIVQDCRERIAVYRALPLDEVTRGLDGTVGVALAALAQNDPGLAAERIQQRVDVLMGHGMPFEDALQIPIIFRRHFVAFSIPALVQQIAGAEAGLMFLSSGCDIIVDIITRFYSSRLETINAELKRFKVMAENIRDGIVLVDAQGTITYANPACRALIGQDERVIGTALADSFDPQARPNREHVLAQFQNGSWSGVSRCRHADGTTFPVEISVVSLADAAVIVVRDVRDQQAKESRLRLFELLVENSIDGISVTDFQNRIEYVNPASARMAGFANPGDMLGMIRNSLSAPEESGRITNEIVPALRESGSWQGRIWVVRPDGTRWLAQVSNFVLTDTNGKRLGLGAVTRDVTAEHATADERERLREEVIRVQELALRELSTPLIPITDQVVVMPLIGTVDSRRAQQVVESLLHGIADSKAQLAIIDITGVPIVDTQVANALLRAAQAVRLLGAQVMLTGIRPEVAQTLVGLGSDMGGIITRSTLQSAVAYAIRRALAV